MLALIITVILLVILATVTINAVFDSGIIWQASNGTQNYVSAEKTENEIIGNTANIMQEYINGTYSSGSDSGEDSGGSSGGETGGTEDTGMSSTELASVIGSYVDYTPTTGTFESSETYNGYATKSFTTIDGLSWRILFVDDDTLTLISQDVANTDFYLSGYNGYNNGVKLLNDACKAMYSNDSLGATARSLNVDDIQSVSSYDETTYTNGTNKNGDEVTLSYKYYPNIFAKETTGYVNSAYGEDYTRSQQDEYITGYSQASTLKGKYTYFTYTMSDAYMDNVYYAMFTCQSGTSGSTSHTVYWLASRCADTNSSNSALVLRMFRADNAVVSTDDMYSTLDRSFSGAYALRTVVEIDLSAVTVGETGSGTSGEPYSITAK